MVALWEPAAWGAGAQHHRQHQESKAAGGGVLAGSGAQLGRRAAPGLAPADPTQIRDDLATMTAPRRGEKKRKIKKTPAQLIATRLLQPAKRRSRRGAARPASPGRGRGAAQGGVGCSEGANPARQRGDGTTAPRAEPCRAQLWAGAGLQRKALSWRQRCPKFPGALRRADAGDSGESLQPLHIFIPPLFPLAPRRHQIRNRGQTLISPPKPTPSAPSTGRQQRRDPKLAGAELRRLLNGAKPGWDLPPPPPPPLTTPHPPAAAPTSALPPQASSSALCRARRRLQRRSDRCLPGLRPLCQALGGRAGVSEPLSLVPSSGFSSGTRRRAGIHPDFPRRFQFPGREKRPKIDSAKSAAPGGAAAAGSPNADV